MKRRTPDWANFDRPTKGSLAPSIHLPASRVGVGLVLSLFVYALIPLLTTPSESFAFATAYRLSLLHAGLALSWLVLGFYYVMAVTAKEA